MKPAATERRQDLATVVLLTALIVLALALRFWRLGSWSIDGDEIHTLQDSIILNPGNPRPLLYLLNHYVVRPFLPLDEFGIRLLPAIFGVLAIPAFYAVVRRLVGTRAALFAALLVAVSSIHLYYSQLARYWSLVFLLSAVYPFVLYWGIRDRNGRTIALGTLASMLAALAHPSSMLLLGGLLLFLFIDLRHENIRQLWNKAWVRRAALGLAGLTALAAVASISILHDWIVAHPGGGQPTANLLHGPSGRGIKQILYLLSFVDGLTVPLTLFGALGVLMLWQGRDRSLGALLACLFIFPVATLVLISFRAPVSTAYLVPATPVVFIGASVALDRLTEIDLGIKPAWLPVATMVLLMIASGTPALVSQYRDGRRHDFAGAARWLKGRQTQADVVYSDHPGILGHYLPGAMPQRLVADTARLADALRLQQQSGGGGAVWIVAPSPHAFRSNAKLPSLTAWVFDNCQLHHTTGVTRLDFRQDQLQIYRCPAGNVDQLGAQIR